MNENDRDEKRFFRALNDLFNSAHLFAKSLGKPVRPHQVYFNSHFRKMGFSPEDEQLVENSLKMLGCDFNIDSAPMTHHIDGYIHDHPLLGSRIIEFDEEQHFTPARQITLRALKGDEFAEMAAIYLNICSDHEYYTGKVMPKHRVRSVEIENVRDYTELINCLEKQHSTNNKFISPRKGFPFIGGRIAQRAYYDLLRDMLHRSEHNRGLKPLIRVPKYCIEKLQGKSMEKQTMKELKEAISGFLNI